MSHSLIVCLFAALLASPMSGLAQVRPDYRAEHEHLLCIVPMIGTGTHADPKRPLYAPAGPSRLPSKATDIVGFNYQISDDGKFAVVDLIARDRKAFQPIYAEGRADVKVFERGKSARAEVETEARRIIKDFDLDKFSNRRGPQ